VTRNRPIRPLSPADREALNRRILAEPDMAARKRLVLTALLDNGLTCIVVDARRPGVDLPEKLRGEPGVPLNLSYHFGTRVEITAWGVVVALSFAGRPYPCRIPWSAIWTVAQGRPDEPGYLYAEFDDAIPIEVRALVEIPEGMAAAGTGPAAVAHPDNDPPAAPTSPRCGHLKLVQNEEE
jgi:stringent starvation protein B